MCERGQQVDIPFQVFPQVDLPFCLLVLDRFGLPQMRGPLPSPATWGQPFAATALPASNGMFQLVELVVNNDPSQNGKWLNTTKKTS